MNPLSYEAQVFNMKFTGHIIITRNHNNLLTATKILINFDKKFYRYKDIKLS